MSNSDLRQILLSIDIFKNQGEKGEELQLAKQYVKKKTRILQSCCFCITGRKYEVTGSPLMSTCLAAIPSHHGAENSDL